MHIIVRKQATHSMFRPHYNSALGGYIRTKDDYMRGLKERGLEPCKDVDYREQRSTSKPYALKSDQREMIKQAATYQRTGERPGSRFKKAYEQLSITKTPKWLRDAQSLTGGFNQEES